MRNVVSSVSKVGTLVYRPYEPTQRIFIPDQSNAIAAVRGRAGAGGALSKRAPGSRSIR
jgi:hypothetical protein